MLQHNADETSLAPGLPSRMSLDMRKYRKRLERVVTLVRPHYLRFDAMVVGVDHFCHQQCSNLRKNQSNGTFHTYQRFKYK
jgi:hypothetical protein